MLLKWKRPQRRLLSAAESWSIDRIQKKSDAYVQYSRYASPEYKALECPACGSSERKEHALTVGGVKFFVCHQCGTHVSDSGSKSRKKQKFSPEQLSYYLSVSADIERSVRDAVKSLGKKESGKFLDLNCGLGFTVDAVRRRPGWMSAGVEAEPIAVYAKEWLGCAVYPDIGTMSHEESLGKFDVVLSRYQLSRTSDPLEFIQSNLSLVREGGSIIFVVPSAEAIYQFENNFRLSEYLFGGDCHFIPTKNGIIEMFKRAGLLAPEIKNDNNCITISYNLNGNLHLNDESLFKTEYREYLKSCARESDVTRFSLIAAQRLFVECVDTGNYSDASVAREFLLSYFDLLEDKIDRFEKSKTIQSHRGGVLPNAGRLLYSEAMLSLNYVADPRRAAVFFALAARYARKFYSLSEKLYASELELAACCDYHELVSLVRDHRPDQAYARRRQMEQNYTVEPWFTEIQNLMLDAEK